MWLWAQVTARLGTESAGKHALIVATLDEELNVVESRLYLGCFPKKYEQFAGFSQAIQSKERFILHCDFSEESSLARLTGLEGGLGRRGARYPLYLPSVLGP